MKTTFSSPRVTCRPALPKDTADVFEFTKFIWDGHDYISYVWNHWLKDPQGLLAVAEYAGHAIGMAKVTLLAPGQWWLEGFRVDPRHQDLKVGSHIHEYITDWWMEHGDGIVRLMTNAKNVRVHHLCERLSFIKTGEVVGFNGQPMDEPTDHFTPATDMKDCADFALASETLSLSNGICDVGWRVLQPNESALQKFTTPGTDFEHKAWWWRGRRAFVTTWDDDDDGEPMLGVGVVACKMEDLPELLKDIRRFASGKYKQVLWIPYSQPQIFTALDGAGWERRWENSAFLYERKK